jgi:hypothetical protein
VTDTFEHMFDFAFHLSEDDVALNWSNQNRHYNHNFVLFVLPRQSPIVGAVQNLNRVDQMISRLMCAVIELTAYWMTAKMVHCLRCLALTHPVIHFFFICLGNKINLLIIFIAFCSHFEVLLLIFFFIIFDISPIYT